MLWKIVAVLGIFFFFAHVLVGAVVLILAVLLYWMQKQSDDLDQAELRQALARKRAQVVARAPPPEQLPADGSMPAKRPGETDGAWAARVQAAEAAAFRAKNR